MTRINWDIMTGASSTQHSREQADLVATRTKAKQKRANDKRMATEARIMRKVIEDGIAAGYVLSVHNGEDYTIRHSTDAVALFNELRTTDEDHLHFCKMNDRGIPKDIGAVFFVYGNDPWEVINDYSTSLEDVIKSATQLADQLAK